ncbi:MAG: ATP-dependent DNA helicase RecG [Candidatus Nomurabacteria bacterium]|nr:ATP-dependent DNA helicase RecG [Candidatus Nomurabacteria bacterium]
MDLSAPLASVKGVGEKTAEKLTKAGLFTVRDLLYYLPRGYEDFSRVQDIAGIRPGRVIIKATVSGVKLSRKRRGLTITEATLSDTTGKLRAVWFNQPYRRTQFVDGKEYYFSGEFEFSYGRYQLMNPSAELASEYDERSDEIVPIYRSSYDLKPRQVRVLLGKLELYIPLVEELLPASVVAGEKLVSRADALRMIHFPKSEAEAARARRRLAFDELFELLLASELNRQENSRLKSTPIPFDVAAVRSFVASLPFKLTDSQRLAAWDIIKNLEEPAPMNRLLQGDVGSGKTVVAGLVACLAARAGFQTAFMAPTEVLAAQHADTLSKLLTSFGVNCTLLTGSVKGKNRELVYKAIADGTAQVVVGTHALITKKVQYHKLGLVVIDEQHRFGVKQRQELLTKGRLMPHLLSMTATPIPRSLQLTVFGDLDISTLNQTPTGRKPVITKIVSPNSEEQVFKKLDAELAAGRQVYYICAQVDENGSDDIKNVQKEYQKLKKRFAGYTTGLLHGRMKTDEKVKTMRDFLYKKTDLLVATTVVEVGMDVPNATAIVVRDADRFGLAQLHQLRGRVGRGEQQSYCYLVTSTSAKPTRRLLEIEKSTDGFYLAEKDLELRGPGEIYGKVQHGELDLQVAKLSDTRLIAQASRAARAFLASGQDLLEYKELVGDVQKYQKITTLN